MCHLTELDLPSCTLCDVRLHGNFQPTRQCSCYLTMASNKYSRFMNPQYAHKWNIKKRLTFSGKNVHGAIMDILVLCVILYIENPSLKELRFLEQNVDVQKVFVGNVVTKKYIASSHCGCCISDTHNCWIAWPWSCFNMKNNSNVLFGIKRWLLECLYGFQDNSYLENDHKIYTRMVKYTLHQRQVKGNDAQPKCIQRRKCYKHICFSKETDLVTGQQSTSLSMDRCLTTQPIQSPVPIPSSYSSPTEQLMCCETSIKTTVMNDSSIKERDRNDSSIKERDRNVSSIKERDRYSTYSDADGERVNQHTLLSRHKSYNTAGNYLQQIKVLPQLHQTQTSFGKADDMKWGMFNDINVTQCLQVYPVQLYSLEETFKFCAEGNTALTNPEIVFSNYLHRLASYSNFDGTQTPSTIKLAKAGFYATGNGTETACFHCGCRHSKWFPHDDPVEIHKEMSPRCDFLLEICSSGHILQHKGNPNSCISTCSEYTDISHHPNGTGESVIVYGNEVIDSIPNGACSPSNGDHWVQNTGSGRIGDGPFPSRNQIHNRFGSCQVADDMMNLASAAHNLSLDNIPSVPNASDPQREVVPQEADRRAPPHTSFSPETLKGSMKNLDIPKPHRDTSSSLSKMPESSWSKASQHFTHPLFPRYHALTVRMSSFAKWPTHMLQSAREMAEAGLFYKGYSDAVACFWCGISLANWEEDDDPCIEHAKWQPSCPFLIQKESQTFVDLIQEDLRQPHKGNPCIEDYNVAEQTLSASKIPDIEKYTALQEMGFQVADIENAVRSSSRWKVPTDDELLEVLLQDHTEDQNDEGMSTPSSSLQRDHIPSSDFHSQSSSSMEDKENQDHLRRVELLTCKICMADEVKVTFLPCGHLVCCLQCSRKVARCPVCRKLIESRIKSYIS